MELQKFTDKEESMFETLNDKDVELLTDGVLSVLERLGMSTPNKEILNALEHMGAKVDYEEKNAKFPKKLVEKFIEEIRKEDKMKWEDKIEGENKKNALSGLRPYNQSVPLFKAPEPPWLFHVGAPFYYDDEKKEKRRATRDDFINLVKLGDKLHPDLGVGHHLILSDVPPIIEPLEAALILLEYAHKPRGVFPLDIKLLDYLLEIEEIAGIKDPHWHWLGAVSFTSPLKLGADTSDRFVSMVKSGHYPAKVFTMATRGVTAPVTVAGAIVSIAAEFVSLWICARALNPEIPLTGTLLSGVMDMKSGALSFSGFDVAITGISVCELIRKWFGVLATPGFGEWTQSKLPGVYTALEKAYQAMIYAAFTGFHPCLGFGQIDSGLSISPVQLLLDREIAKGLKFLEHPLITEDTIGLEAILDVGYGIDKNYLEAEHTIRHFRNCLWEPEFFDRRGWDRGSEEKVLNKANEKVKQLLSEYKKPEVDSDKISRVRQVIERARKKLL